VARKNINGYKLLSNKDKIYVGYWSHFDNHNLNENTKKWDCNKRLKGVIRNRTKKDDPNTERIIQGAGLGSSFLSGGNKLSGNVAYM